MEDFEWDPQKAQTNLEKHGISFETAKSVFGDQYSVEFADDRFDYGEDRYVIIGLVGSRLVAVTYTWRDNVIRLITARGAEPNERRLYNQGPTR